MARSWRGIEAASLSLRRRVRIGLTAPPYGKEFALEKRLSIALQFVTFDAGQRAILLGQDLPPNLAPAMDDFHNGLSDAEQADPKFRFRVAFVPKIAGKASQSNLAVEFVKVGTPKAETVERVLLKETERPKYLPSGIVAKAKEAGFAQFKVYEHTQLLNQLNERNPGKGYGVEIASKWNWYEGWFEKVIEKLEEGWTR